MNKRIKIAIYLLLLLSASLFVWQFRANYSRLMAEGESKADTDLINVKLPDYRAKAVPAQTNYHLAAALEYEEVLKQKLPPERWGWAAVHLCNLYTSKLNQSEKAIILLQRIVTEYGETAAAEKARKRLSQLEEEGVALPPVEMPAESAPQASNLPPGFAPKKL